MASSDTDLAIRLRFISDELTSGLNGAANEVKAWGGTVVEAIAGVEERAEGLKNVFKDAFEAFVGVEIVEQLRKIAETASEASDSMEIAANTARNLGHAVEAATQEEWLQKFAASAKGGGYAITELRDSMQQFAAIGANDAQQKRLIADATGLAAMKNISLAEATHILTMAAAGHVETLSRFGIATKDAEGKTLSFTTIIGNLENAMSGDAQIRANGLAGSIARLGNALNEFVAGPFGQEIEAIFTGGVNAATHFVNALNQLPPGTLQAAAAIGTAVASLTALTLLEPAIALVTATLENGLSIILAPFEILGATARLALAPFVPLAEMAGAAILRLGAAFAATAARGAALVAGPLIGAARTIAGPLVSAIGGAIGSLADVVVGLAGAAAGWVAEGVAAVAAALAPLIPIAALIAAIVGIITVIYEVVTHWSRFTSAAKTAFTFVSGAIQSFIAFARDQFMALGEVLGGVWKYLSGDEKGGIAAMQSGVAKIGAAWKGVGVAIFDAVKGGAQNALAFIEQRFPETIAFIKNKLHELIGSTVGPDAGGTTGASLQGLGGQPKQPGGDQKAIDDALALAKAQIQAALDAAIARVEGAKVALESSSTKVDAYKDSLPGGNPQNLTQALELYRLQNDEIAKERDLQAALLLQKQAYLTAAQKESALADHLPATDKDRVSHAIDLNKEATQHRLSAQQTALEYERIDSAIAKIGRDGQAAFKAVADETQKIADNIAKAAAEMATRGVRGDQEELRMQRSEAERSGQLTPANEALFADREQQLDVALAKIADDLAKRELELARENAYASPEELAAAQEREEEAHYNLTVAIDSERMAHQAYTDALSKSQLNLTNVIDTLAVTFSKLIPGLKVSETPQGGLTAIFDWSALLGDIIEKSKAYRDVQSEVTQVVKVLAQVLDAFRPVIDGVLTVFNAFGNAVIDIYNIFARLLRLIGIMIPILSNLSDNFNALDGSTAPLIQVVHDLPTQNELASGKIATLSTQPIDVSQSDQWNAPITAALQNSNLGGGLLGMLGQILAGVIALKEVLAVAGIGSGLNSGGGGILGFFKNLFNMGGSSGYGGYGPGSTPAPADGSIPGEYTGLLGPSDAGDVDMGNAAAGSWGDVADATSANTSAVNDLNTSITSGPTSSSSGGLTGALGSVSEGLVAAQGAMEVFKGLSSGGTAAETVGGLGEIGGTIAGAILGGPLGASIGAAAGQVLGTIIGSFFGPHPTAAKDPDMFEGQTGYGQTMANLVGAGTASAGANGTSYDTQSSVTEFIQAMGLTPPGKAPGGNNQSASYGLQAIVDYLDKFSANSPPPGISEAEYQQMQGTLGTGQISSFNTRPGDPNIGDLEVNGNDTTYSQLGNWMTEIMSSFQDAVQTGSLSLQQTFQELVASATPVTNGLTNLGNQLTAGAGVTTLPSTTGSSTSSASEATAPLTINMGDINVDHMHGVDDVQAISEAQAEATRVLLRSRPYLVTR